MKKLKQFTLSDDPECYKFQKTAKHAIKSMPLKRYWPSTPRASVAMTRVPCTKDSDSTRVLNENYGLGLESSIRTRTQVQVGWKAKSVLIFTFPRLRLYCMYCLSVIKEHHHDKRPAVSSVAKRTLSVREVWGSIPRPVKSA